MTPETLKREILEKVAEYHRLVHAAEFAAVFAPGGALGERALPRERRVPARPYHPNGNP